MHFLLLAFLSTSVGMAEAESMPVVSMPFQVNRPRLTIAQAHALGKRDTEGTSNLPIANFLTSYTVQLLIGTPAQNITSVIDTGSSDFWLMDNSDTNTCRTSSDGSHAGDCSVRFHPGDSSSYSANDTQFSISYGDGSSAEGNFCQDNIQVGSVTVDKANFALATRSNTSTSVFGIGPVFGESTVSTVTQEGNAKGTYDNILTQMKNQGHISTLTYSLWLNGAASDSGNVLFGGIDHAKYQGDFTVVPILKEYKPGSLSAISLTEPRSVAVMLTAFGLYQASQVENVATGSIPVLLDSGTSLSYLPTEFIDAFAKSLGATWSTHMNMYLTTCNHAGGAVFEIAGAQFQVPFNQMLFPLSEDDGSAVGDEDGNPVCALGLLAMGNYSPDNTFILGETFLRGVYAVYDYENWQVGLAKTNYNATSEDINTIGSEGVPGASTAASYSATTYNSAFSTFSATIFAKADSLDSFSGSSAAASTTGSNDATTSGTTNSSKASSSSGSSSASATSAGSSGSSSSGSGSGSGSGSSSSSSSSSSSGSSKNYANCVTDGLPLPLLLICNLL